jgi:hypothetical protein
VASRLAFSLEKAEAVPKRIATECSRSMLWVLEELLAFGTKRLSALKGDMQVFDVKVEMNGSPVALEAAAIFGGR